jgi:hypothetical protein
MALGVAAASGGGGWGALGAADAATGVAPMGGHVWMHKSWR